MARRSWEAARLASQAASFGYFQELLRVRSGAANVELYGVLDTGLDAIEESGQSPDGTFPIMARLSVWRQELGFVPTTNEEIRVKRMAYPEEERLYLVIAVDDTTDLIDIQLQAHAYNGRQFSR